MNHFQQESPWANSRAGSPGALELRQFFARNGVVHRWLDPDVDPLVALLGASERLERPLPPVLLADGRTFEPPAAYQDARSGLYETGAARYVATSRWRAEVAAAVGLQTRPARELYDVRRFESRGRGRLGASAGPTRGSRAMRATFRTGVSSCLLRQGG